TAAADVPSGEVAWVNQERDQMSISVGPSRMPAHSSPRTTGKPMRPLRAPNSLATRMITAMHNTICSEGFIGLHGPWFLHEFGIWNGAQQSPPPRDTPRLQAETGHAPKG